MKPDLTAILDKLAALRRRERALLAARALVLGVGAVLVVWGGAMALAAGGFDRLSALQVLAVASVAVLGGLAGWAGHRWWRAGDEGRHARELEDANPELRGRLITALERREGPVRGESASLLALIVRRAEKMVAAVDAKRLYPSRVLLRPSLAAMLLALMWAVFGLFAPLGPFDTLAWLGGEARAVASKTGESLIEVPEPDALVGDIVLRYEYPDYTGLPPVEVANSDGTAHGPPGTRVTLRARTAEVFDEVRLQAYALEPEIAELVGGRDLTAAFSITAEGTWALIMRRGPAEARSKDFLIELEPDLAPVVEVITESDRMEIPFDQPIPLRWRVRDDFGVQKAELSVDGRPGLTLREPLDTPALLDGELGRTPDQLGLKPGDEVTLRVVGWDNDEVSGSKSGESRPIRIVVLGPEAQTLRFLRLRRELRDALIDVLADFALDPAPLPEQQGELASWAGEASTRFEPIDALVEEYWDRFDERSLEGRLVQELRRQANGLLRFVEAVAEPRSKDKVNPVDAGTLGELHEELVTTLETDILMLDMMVRYDAIRQLYNTAKLLRGVSVSLRSEAESGQPGAALYNRLDLVDQLNAELGQAARDYDGGSISEVVSAWSEDIGRASTRTRELIAEGDDAAARDLAVDLANSIERLMRTLEASQREMEEATEEDKQALQDLIEELERLEAAERALLDDTREAREEDGGDTKSLVDAWQQAERLAQRMAGLSEAVLARLKAESGERLPREVGDAERLQRQVTRLSRSVSARDLQSSREENAFSMFIARQVGDVLRYSAARRSGEEGPSNAQNVKQLNELVGAAIELDTLLSRVDAQVNQASPGLEAASGELSTAQQGLHDELAEVLPVASQLAQQLPMGAPGLVESLEGAEREMSRATDALDRARAVEAEGAEEAAADRIRQALEALAQAAAAAQAMQDSMEGGGQPGEGATGGGGDLDSQDLNSPERVALPDPEEFQTDEAYREALLRGMQGEVPEEFEALKRRYYEELVRQ